MIFRTLGTVVVCMLALPSLAHAYIDPGTGSIILQTIFGGVAGAAFIVKLYWGRIKNFTKRKRSLESNPSEPKTLDSSQL